MKVLYLVASLIGVAYSKNLPSFVEVCHRPDAKIKDCLVRNIEKLRPMFLKGIPELQIPSLNPLIIPKASLEIGDRFSADFNEIQIFFANEFVIEKLDFNVENFKLDLSILFPRLRILSNYNIKGKLLVLELDGSGSADGNYTNVRAHFKGEGVHYDKGGKDHIKLDKTSIDMEIGKPHLFFDRIFGDNEELNANTNKVINENIETLISELKPVISKIVQEFISGITNNLFEKYTFDELFLKN
ncbi:circadian clock-controlled protein daywake [Leptinotarsa decemlineata]|uniref:circadian clock-controlled protein daywake n=1 Tax=Leptinotarsa decemlineata TaxID=7539 RepID=UPI000C25409E|nr:uncharacterized protein LOC111510432 [Leptinotarsa decemlineata]